MIIYTRDPAAIMILIMSSMVNARSSGFSFLGNCMLISIVNRSFDGVLNQRYIAMVAMIMMKRNNEIRIGSSRMPHGV